MTRFLVVGSGGVVESVHGSTLVLLAAGARVTLTVVPSAAVTLDGHSATLGDLAAGDAVDVSLDPRGRVTDVAAARATTPAVGSRHHTVFDFALATGMRPAEYLALRWSDVDLRAGSVTVQRVLVRTKGGGHEFQEPKTSKSRRSMPLSASTVRLLNEWKRKQSAEILDAGEAYERLGLVFAADNGRPLHMGNLRQRHFKAVLKRAHLPTTLRLYDLRTLARRCCWPPASTPRSCRSASVTPA